MYTHNGSFRVLKNKVDLNLDQRTMTEWLKTIDQEARTCHELWWSIPLNFSRNKIRKSGNTYPLLHMILTMRAQKPNHLNCTDIHHRLTSSTFSKSSMCGRRLPTVNRFPAVSALRLNCERSSAKQRGITGEVNMFFGGQAVAWKLGTGSGMGIPRVKP